MTPAVAVPRKLLETLIEAANYAAEEADYRAGIEREYPDEGAEECAASLDSTSEEYSAAALAAHRLLGRNYYIDTTAEEAS